MDSPELVYYAYDHKNRLQLIVRYDTIEHARKHTKRLQRLFQSKLIGNWVSYAKPEPNSGTFEVDITFADDVTTDDMEPLFQPPASNRGVTKNV